MALVAWRSHGARLAASYPSTTTQSCGPAQLEDVVYFFACCTFLSEKELLSNFPEAEFVAEAEARNHMVQFRTVGSSVDRGYCHVADSGPEVWGRSARGIVYRVDDDRLTELTEGFECVALTVAGDDGTYYDCFTYGICDPGLAMKPPRFYWEKVTTGLAEKGFSQEYQDQIHQMFEASRDCPDFDRPPPSA